MMAAFLFSFVPWLLLMGPVIMLEVILLLFLIHIGKHKTDYLRLMFYHFGIFTVIFLISMFRAEAIMVPMDAIDIFSGQLESFSH